jgi:hypothetical protein
VDELSQSLKYQATDLEQQCKTSDSAIKQTIDGTLKSDDKLLSSLQKLAGDLDPGLPEDDGMISRIRELCAKYDSQLFIIIQTFKGASLLDMDYWLIFNSG